MSVCEHCEGQRFDRAQVLRVLRAMRTRLREKNPPTDADLTLAMAIDAVRTLEIPHLEHLEEMEDGGLIH
jgi:hypothetical protein